MPIINLKQFFNFSRVRPENNRRKTVNEVIAEVGDKNINQRMEEIYDKDQLDLQLLFEKWASKNDWKLKDEAIPLLLAIDPESRQISDNFDNNNIYDELWMHARDCVDQRLLKVINHEQEPEEWRVKPVDIYRWAIISRIEVPAALASLMEFIISIVKQSVADKNGSDQISMDTVTGDYDKNRENILGMALAILAAFPEQCKNAMGEVTAENILKVMGEKTHNFPETGDSVLSTAVRRELLEQWLKKISRE